MLPHTILSVAGREYRVSDLAGCAGAALARLPYVHRILLENVLRNAGDDTPRAVATILDWLTARTSEQEIPFQPGRVFMHDTTCVPALVDIAAMRETLSELGHDPQKLNPVLPVDVSIDHSVAVDLFGSPDALSFNMQREIGRNGERYRFMKWAARALDGVHVHPPGTGIMHTINMERVATVVATAMRDGAEWAFPDALIGTDSHTPMVNGIGVLGWGVGGLEAESVMFGMPVMMRIPDVIGVRFTGRLREGRMATDLALTVTQRLRQIDLSGRFVEYFGPGVTSLSAGERAVIANMAPEYGASTGYFPIDQQTLSYLRVTGRSETQIELVERYARQQQLWFDPEGAPDYTDVIEIDLDAVEVSFAGPRRPQDRLPAGQTAIALQSFLAPKSVEGGLPHGAVALAAITSCTNTTEPRLLVAAGLLAKKARKLGLTTKPWVKTSFAPGSPSATRYLQRAGLMNDLEALGFGVVGFGCTTCIGNSGPLTPQMADAVRQQHTVPVAVLSGNRNFPGRVHADIEAGFLASPPMVVACALAGDLNRNILTDAVGPTGAGQSVHLADLWPTGPEIDAAMQAVIPQDIFDAYDEAEGSKIWQDLEAADTPLFAWDHASTYIRRPPFVAMHRETCLGQHMAYPLLVLGDDITTDHISPAGQIPAKGEAGRHLVARQENSQDLNVFASRRGNWEVMLRGLYTNKTVRNLLDPSLEPGETLHIPSGEGLPIWQAAERYKTSGDAVVVIAGERYGMGSSRDWAAKGLSLLSVKAVLASSFERIHRTNLIGMGILPLYLPHGVGPGDLNISRTDRLEIVVTPESLTPRGQIAVVLHRDARPRMSFDALIAVETKLEIALLRAGGVIPYILQRAIST
jgi:aconitate hydratase